MARKVGVMLFFHSESKGSCLCVSLSESESIPVRHTPLKIHHRLLRDCYRRKGLRERRAGRTLVPFHQPEGE